MTRFTSLLWAFPLALAAPLVAQQSDSAAQWHTSVDTAGAGAIIAQAMDHSQVMPTLEHLSDVIGPRLTGSAAARQANDWTASKFREYGLTANLEAWPFGVTWQRGPSEAWLLSPFKRQMTAPSWAWTAGTAGPVAGRVVMVNVSNADSLQANMAKVKGAWVMTREPADIWNPDGPAMTAADSAQRREEMMARRRAFTRDTSAAAIAKARQFRVDLPYLLKRAGALGELTDGSKEFALFTMSGSPLAVSPLPHVVLGHEDYSLLYRLVQQGVTPRFSANVHNTLGTKSVNQWNTVAEIKGSEKPGEVVILGAHLDSWDLGTGTTDNGTGAMVVLEAARAIEQAGLHPKRTIRFILFTGEEEGLMGSRAYAEQHKADADSIQAVLVLDNGTGAITGQALQGRGEFEHLWYQLLAPVASMGADTVRNANKGGTDHLSFLPYGVPGFNFDQISRGYGHTHHSQVDTYEHAVEPDLKQASAVMAVTAYELANLPDMLPRGETHEVEPQTPGKPSPGLVSAKGGKGGKAGGR